jgi:hypothetical protein
MPVFSLKCGESFPRSIRSAYHLLAARSTQGFYHLIDCQLVELYNTQITCFHQRQVHRGANMDETDPLIVHGNQNFTRRSVER